MPSIPVFDVLAIGNSLQNKLQDFSRGEVQLFSYLSCLLSLYDSNPTAFWSYTFIKNEVGSPFSESIDRAIDNLIYKQEIIEKEDGYLYISESGINTYGSLSSFFMYQKRHLYLKVACESIRSLPFGNVREAINNEPVLKGMRKLPDTRILNDDQSAAIQVLYSQFHNLKIALEDKYDDLLIPSLVWINYLVKLSNISS